MSDERSLGERQRACVLCPHEDDNDDAMGYCAKHGTEMRDQAEGLLQRRDHARVDVPLEHVSDDDHGVARHRPLAPPAPEAVRLGRHDHVAEETLRAVCESNQNNFERAETTEARLAATTGEVARLTAERDALNREWARERAWRVRLATALEAGVGIIDEWTRGKPPAPLSSLLRQAQDFVPAAQAALAPTDVVPHPPEAKPFDQALAEAHEALKLVGTGKLRHGELVTEGPRSYVADAVPPPQPTKEPSK